MVIPYEKLIEKLRFGEADEEETEEAMAQAADLLDASNKAFLDIATCSIPDIPTGATVSMEQFGPFAMERARSILKKFYPTWDVSKE